MQHVSLEVPFIYVAVTKQHVTVFSFALASAELAAVDRSIFPSLLPVAIHLVFHKVTFVRESMVTLSHKLPTSFSLPIYKSAGQYGLCFQIGTLAESVGLAVFEQPFILSSVNVLNFSKAMRYHIIRVVHKL